MKKEIISIVMIMLISTMISTSVNAEELLRSYSLEQKLLTSNDFEGEDAGGTIITDKESYAFNDIINITVTLNDYTNISSVGLFTGTEDVFANSKYWINVTENQTFEWSHNVDSIYLKKDILRITVFTYQENEQIQSGVFYKDVKLNSDSISITIDTANTVISINSTMDIISSDIITMQSNVTSIDTAMRYISTDVSDLDGNMTDILDDLIDVKEDAEDILDDIIDIKNDIVELQNETSSNFAKQRFDSSVVFNTLVTQIYSEDVISAPSLGAYCDRSIEFYNIIHGTNGPDNIIGTDLPDLIHAYGGNDMVTTIGVNNCIYLGSGNDFGIADKPGTIFYGGTGDDSIKIHGNGIAYGEEGNDMLFINNATRSHLLDGGEGTDICTGDPYQRIQNVVDCEG